MPSYVYHDTLVRVYLAASVNLYAFVRVSVDTIFDKLIHVLLFFVLTTHECSLALSD